MTNEKYEQRLRRHLESKKIPTKCPLCGESGYTITPPMSTPVADEGSFVTSISIVCENCAFMRSFSGNQIGLFG